MKLYEINAELERILESASEYMDPETGEIPENFGAEIDSLSMQREEKALSIATYIKSIVAEENAVHEEEKKLQKRRKVLLNKIASLKGYLSNMLYNNEKMADSKTKISWRKSVSVEILSEENIPDVYCTYTRKISVQEIKKGLSSGKEIPGAKLTTKNNLQVI